MGRFYMGRSRCSVLLMYFIYISLSVLLLWKINSSFNHSYNLYEQFILWRFYTLFIMHFRAASVGTNREFQPIRQWAFIRIAAVHVPNVTWRPRRKFVNKYALMLFLWYSKYRRSAIEATHISQRLALMVMHARKTQRISDG